MSPTSTFKFPTVEETLAHPAYPACIWNLQPDEEGILPVAESRGGPVNISWQVHGEGPIKICLLMGLAGMKTSWQRQTRYFGHDRRDQYSVLILDNRGIGDSDKPLARYSTSMMAADVLEVLDHVGWTSERQVHLVGISLGGMIAQEIACAAPKRLASLSLLCTAAEVKNTTTYSESFAEAVSMLKPKSMELAIQDTAKKIFAEDFLQAPDAETVPSPGTTPKFLATEGQTPESVMFDSNFQRFQAQELSKRFKPGAFTIPGFVSQLMAAGWHRKSEEQLKVMADVVGRENIMVMHGTNDKMIIPSNGKRLIEMIQPGTSFMVEGMGHVPVMEKQKWFNETLEEKLQAWSK